MEFYWAWAILLLIVGVALAVLEVFIPSGGVLAFLAVSAIVGAVILGFMQGPIAGMAILAVAIFGLPAAVVLALKWWPHTPMGRRVLLDPQATGMSDDPRRRKLKELIGHVGVVKSKMLPSGIISIDGRTVDATSEGMPIEPGQSVKVIAVHGTTVTVRPIGEAPSPPSPDDVLAKPVQSVVPDPFEDEDEAGQA